MTDFINSLPMDGDTFNAFVLVAIGFGITGFFATLNWINKRIEKTR